MGLETPRFRLISGVVLAAAAVAAVLAHTDLTVAEARDGAPSPLALGEAGDPPTFYGDVLAILQENCVDCHQPQGMNLGGMVAPMSLMTYEEARPWAPLMARAVEEGRMPPWHAHPVHQGTFVGERYLDEEQKRTLIAWAQAGAPAGDRAAAPDGLDFGEEERAERGEWWIGEPDLVLGFEEPYCVTDDAWDVNVGVNLVVPEDEHPEPRWIRSTELRAGGHEVHHICGEPFGCIAPGWDPYMYSDGFAKLLPRVGEIRLGMHYNKRPGPGTAFCDESRGALVFYEEGDMIRHLVRTSVLSVGESFVIPAGHPSYSLTREFPFEVDTYILSLTPHMHYRGKQAKYELEHPDGRRELLLFVPEYHFEWQRMYVFKDPPVAPAGSKLLWTPTWDNSPSNPFNPDPNRDVPYGLPTEDEMGNGWLDYTPVEPLNHVVGRDPIPEDLLEQVTRQLEARAGRESRPSIVTVPEP